MPVLVTSIFDDDSIENERASMETAFSHCKSMRNLGHSRAANSVVSGRIWPNFELIQALMYVIFTCKYDKDPINNS